MRRHQHGTLEKGDSALWHDTTYDVLELRGIIPVSDWQGECCFAGIRETWIQQLQVKGSSWGQQLDGKPPEGNRTSTATVGSSAERRSPARASVYRMQILCVSADKPRLCYYYINSHYYPILQIRLFLILAVVVVAVISVLVVMVVVVVVEAISDYSSKCTFRGAF